MATRRRRQRNYYDLPDETPRDRRLETLGTLQALDTDARAADAATMASVLGSLAQLYNISGAAQEQRLNEIRVPYLEDEYAARVANLRSEAAARDARTAADPIQSTNFALYPEEFQAALLRGRGVEGAMTDYDAILSAQAKAEREFREKREAEIEAQKTQKSNSAAKRRAGLQALIDANLAPGPFHIPY